MPFDKAKYPDDWPIISRRIRVRSGERCECEGECGLHHERRCVEMHRAEAYFAKGIVVLTVAHLNHDPMDCRDENLKAMCQRCHLRYDRHLHARNAARTRREKKKNLDLFGEEEEKDA